MSREITLRAWDEETGVMDLDPAVEVDWARVSVNALLANKVADYPDPFPQYIFMQYTGVEDKHGVKVFEGDLVRVLDRDWPSGTGDPKQHMLNISSVCQVLYEPAEFYLKQVRGPGLFSPALSGVYGRDLFEVIGNIYTNPELLEAA